MIADFPPPTIELTPLPYEERLDSRDLSQVDLVIIHCTETPTLASAREFGEKVLYDQSGTGNSGHFYIDRDGRVLQYVDPKFTAHHTKGYNARAVGIELVNIGRYPNWLDSNHQSMDEAYTKPQIDALIGLLKELGDKYPHLQFIAGHEDLDRTQVGATDDAAKMVFRKQDPGRMFPWTTVLKHIRFTRILQ